MKVYTKFPKKDIKMPRGISAVSFPNRSSLHHPASAYHGSFVCEASGSVDLKSKLFGNTHLKLLWMGRTGCVWNELLACVSSITIPGFRQNYFCECYLFVSRISHSAFSERLCPFYVTTTYYEFFDLGNWSLFWKRNGYDRDKIYVTGERLGVATVCLSISGFCLSTHLFLVQLNPVKNIFTTSTRLPTHVDVSRLNAYFPFLRT